MKYMFILLLGSIFVAEVKAQAIGSKVNLVTTTGVKYTGTITDKQDGKFKVKYDGIDFEAWLNPGQFELVDAQTAANMPAAASVGSKVNLKDVSGKSYTGTVTEIKGNQYNIKYDGYDFNAWLRADQFNVVNTSATANIHANVGKFKVGDRVECDKAGINSWEKGTIMPLLKYDFTDGKTYRVRLDAQANGGMYLEGIVVMVEKIRLLPNEPAYKSEKTAVPVGKVTVDANNTLSADRAILVCPFEQVQVKNGTAPNAELCKRLIRCKKGESAASTGYDGAITIDVTSLQIGTPRKWSYTADYGNGTAGTFVYPVKATYTEKVFYRDRTQVTENWVRILNFYVNAFGEWAIGSEESIKIGVTKNVIRE